MYHYYTARQLSRVWNRSCVNSQLITGELMVIWERERQTWRQRRDFFFCFLCFCCFLPVYLPWATSILQREGPIQKITWSVQLWALFRGMIVYPQDIWRKLKMEVGRVREKKERSKNAIKTGPVRRFVNTSILWGRAHMGWMRTETQLISWHLRNGHLNSCFNMRWWAVRSDILHCPVTLMDCETSLQTSACWEGNIHLISNNPAQIARAWEGSFK